jgi:two-component system phosphate regulon sensor histidine kinase PhoR/two-component system sensor histidine kinase VicK
MDYGKKYKSRLFLSIIFSLVIVGALTVGLWLFFADVFTNDIAMQLLSFGIAIATVLSLIGYVLSYVVYQPLKRLSDAIVFTGHKSGGTPPRTDNLFIGKELISALSSQVYDIASMSKNSDEVAATVSDELPSNPQTASPAPTMQAATPSVLDRVASPVFGLDSNQKVRAANKSALTYIEKKAEEVLGKPFYDIANLSFDTEDTLDTWLTKSQDSVVNDVRRWERVRINDLNGKALKQFDLTSSFSKQSNPDAIETMIVFFDRTEQYQHDDQDISFVAMAVHELRTPLTVMKGYIEVFQDEVGPSLNPEMADFMKKMQASAQQLTAFVGNILNVARAEENALVLTLQKHDWPEIVKTAIDDLELRAQVHNKHIELNIADNIPPVAVDRISIHEVINNLVDNAIKYSGESEKIVITSTMNKDGMVETSVQDFGLGIPDSAVSDLFQKFYRSHHSKVQVSGTGLGLYLCKALVTAHGGNIWVHTKEGQGSIFSFTIQTFEQANTDNQGQDGIQRGAHGWIKNHTLNRQ